MHLKRGFLVCQATIQDNWTEKESCDVNLGIEKKKIIKLNEEGNGPGQKNVVRTKNPDRHWWVKHVLYFACVRVLVSSWSKWRAITPRERHGAESGGTTTVEASYNSGVGNPNRRLPERRAPQMELSGSLGDARNTVTTSVHARLSHHKGIILWQPKNMWDASSSWHEQNGQW